MKGKVIGALVFAFVLYYLFTRPNDAATAVNSGADKLGDGAGSLGTFIGALGPTALGIAVLFGLAWWLMSKK